MDRRGCLAVQGWGLAGYAAGCVGGSEARDVDSEFLEDGDSSDVEIGDSVRLNQYSVLLIPILNTFQAKALTYTGKMSCVYEI